MLSGKLSQEDNVDVEAELDALIEADAMAEMPEVPSGELPTAVGVGEASTDSVSEEVTEPARQLVAAS